MNKNLSVGELKKLIKDLDDSLDVIIPIYDYTNDEIINVEQVSNVSVISLESSSVPSTLCLSSCNIEEPYKKLISKVLDKDNIVSLVVKTLR